MRMEVSSRRPLRPCLSPAVASPGESLLTRVQEISLNYHTKCEQYARFASGAFLNFNGTAGVWRRACIEKAGGWNARTTVEDMDLSLRAYLQGWKFVFLYEVPVRKPAWVMRSSQPECACPVSERTAVFVRRVQKAAAPLVLRADAAVAKGDLRCLGIQHLMGAKAVP